MCSMYSNSSYESTAKMGDLTDFQKGQVIGARLAGASITKTRTLLGVSITAVFNVMTAYTNHGKTSPATRTSGRKPKLTERDCRTLKRSVSKNDNYCSKGDARTQYSSCGPSLTRASQIRHPR